MKKCVCFIVLTALVFAAVSADVKIINPVKGVWANKQSLVLELSEGESAYYSLNGSDPRESGFAYDGPVALDVSGDVEVRIASVDASGVFREYRVSYTVAPVPFPASYSMSAVGDAVASGILDYTAGDVLSLPPELDYSLGGVPESFQKGSAISYGAGCILSRCIPCVLTDGTGKWRFIIKTKPALSGSFGMRDVPFQITDWNTLSFTNDAFIYRVDNAYWTSGKERVALDRTISHTISWQSVAVAPGNPISFFVLPPKPEVDVERREDGSETIVMSGGAGFRFGIEPEKGQGTVLFETAELDTFFGDEVSGVFTAGVYYDSVYQGTLSVPYSIDRRSPSVPVFLSSAESFYSRRAVKLSLTGDGQSDLFIAVSNPVMLSGTMTKKDAASLIDVVEADDFVPFTSPLTLDSPSEDAVYYKICAYAADRSGNKSAYTLYDVVVDKYDYYIDASADKNCADGTRDDPYVSLADCLAAVGDNRFANITISGTLAVSEEETVIASNCVLRGDGDARLVFGVGSFITVRSASLALLNLIVRRDDTGVKRKINNPLIRLEHSVLVSEDCEIGASFAESGSVISADTSVVTINGCGITSSAERYSSCISAVASKLKIIDSRISTIAQTAVNFSVQDGEFELRSSSCRVTGSYGRAAELFGGKSKITGNSLAADLRYSGASLDAVYTDAKNISLEYGGNTESGY